MRSRGEGYERLLLESFTLCVLISVWIAGEVKITLMAKSFDQCLLPVQSLQKTQMRERTSAGGVSVIGRV